MSSKAPSLTVSSSPSTSTSTSLSRLQTIANHMSPASITNFPAEAVPQAPEDPLFGLMRAYKADQSPDKVDLVRQSCVTPLHVFAARKLTTRPTLGNRCVPRRQCKAVGSPGCQEGVLLFLILLPVVLCCSTVAAFTFSRGDGGRLFPTGRALLPASRVLRAGPPVLALLPRYSQEPQLSPTLSLPRSLDNRRPVTNQPEQPGR